MSGEFHGFFFFAETRQQGRIMVLKLLHVNYIMMSRTAMLYIFKQYITLIMTLND